MLQLGGILGRLLDPLVKIDLPLMKNFLAPLAKSDLISLRLAATASATDVTIHENNFGLG